MLSSCRNIETISKNVSGLTPVNLLNSVASNFFIFLYFFIFCLLRDTRFYTKKFRLRKMSILYGFYSSSFIDFYGYETFCSKFVEYLVDCAIGTLEKMAWHANATYSRR